MNTPAPPHRSAEGTADFDVVVVGGGLAGLVTARLLALAGFSLALVDVRPVGVGDAQPAALDGRTTALLQGSLRVLEACGVWPELADVSGALVRMRLCERAAGGERMVLFDCRELGETAFGYNIANECLRRALLEHLSQMAQVRLFAPARVSALNLRAAGGAVLLEDGRRLGARLVIGADGRSSPCRKAARIHARQSLTGQVAVAASFRHSLPHEDTATEFHRDHGPLVLVPLPGRASSLVWVEAAAEAERLASLSDSDFAVALEAASDGLLGEVESVEPRFRYPVGINHAERMVAPGLALVGEAVHALPPIGAQGLNLSLADVATLAELMVDARRAGEDWGGADVLVAYERRRQPDVRARVAAVAALNRSVSRPGGVSRALRGLGLGLVDRARPLKRALMQQGMAPLGGSPRLLRGEQL